MVVNPREFEAVEGEVVRVSDGGNTIVETEDTTLNVGPLDVGLHETIEVGQITTTTNSHHHIGMCLESKHWSGRYREKLSGMLNQPIESLDKILVTEMLQSDREESELKSAARRVEVLRISGNGNAIVDWTGMFYDELNVGPLDAEQGDTVTVLPLNTNFGICLNRDRWKRRDVNYPQEVNKMASHPLPTNTLWPASEKLPVPEEVHLSEENKNSAQAQRVKILRISNSGNAIVGVSPKRELNVGKLDAEEGDIVRVAPINNQWGICLDQSRWVENYFKKHPYENLSESTLSEETEHLGQTSETDTQESEPSPTDETELEVLRQSAEEDGQENPPERTTETQTTQYTRSTKVKEYVKRRADGHCEGCDEPAPFVNPDGEPYLHAHHVHELSDGGTDTVETVIALCPNCHYEVHHGKGGEKYNQELIERLAEIEDVSLSEITEE